jgi:hypothetical protein
VPKVNFHIRFLEVHHHPKPITRCHVTLFDKIYLIYAESDLHVGY